MTDWRLPDHRREVFLDSWEMHLNMGTLPGLVHLYLPAIAEHYELDEDGRAWLAWLNGNTQNPAMTVLLLEASGFRWQGWKKAVDFWSEHYALMDFDTDRRHQKPRFGEATEDFVMDWGPGTDQWLNSGMLGWGNVWDWALSLPHMGRLSAWSLIEYARILFGRDAVPDADTLMLHDASGSKSHRAGLAVVAGYPAEHWGWKETQPIVEALEDLGEGLLDEMQARRSDASRLDLESALCTYKGWFKPNRRYPNVYADMAWQRLMKAELRFGKSDFTVLREARETLPEWARVECNPADPGLAPSKQNLFRETGEIPMLGHMFPRYWSSFDEAIHPGGRPSYVCGCPGCWACSGHEKECTCDVDWDAIYSGGEPA